MEDQDQFIDNELPLDAFIDARIQLIEAIDEGNLEATISLIEAGVPIPSDSIILASDKNRTNVLEFLLRNTNINPNLDDGYALSLASKKGYTDSVRLLLNDPRTNPNIEDHHAFIKAVDFGHIDVVRLFLSNPRFQPNSDVFELSLESSVQEGNTDMLGLLLSSNFKDYNPYSALNVSFSENLNMSRMILEWYSDNDVPIDDFINEIIPEERKYILMYYDINKIDENGDYDFGEVEPEFVDVLLAKYPYDREKIITLLDLPENVVSSRTQVFESRGIPMELQDYIGRFM
jgi:hypothetical protein